VLRENGVSINYIMETSENPASRGTDAFVRPLATHRLERLLALNTSAVHLYKQAFS
jgi:hypothetical protein